MIKIVFFSSSDIALPLLSALAKDSRCKILSVVTQPDKPAGRSLILKKNPVKLLSEELGLNVFQPERLDANAYDILSLQDADIFLTFAYGKIFPEDFLKLAKIASINVHASLLPKYRGSSPIQAAILNSEKKTGISIMKMVKEMDAGPVYKQIDIDITEDMTAGDLHEKIALLSANSVPDILFEINANSIFHEQNHLDATFTKKINKDDGFLDFKKNTKDVYSIFKAYSPWPGVWTKYNNNRLKLIDLEKSDEVIEPGVVKFENSSVKIGTLDGSIDVKSLQFESKNVTTAKEFIAGYKMIDGARLPS